MQQNTNIMLLVRHWIAHPGGGKVRGREVRNDARRLDVSALPAERGRAARRCRFLPTQKSNI